MSRQVTIGVLALQGDVREHLAALAAAGAAARSVRRASELDDVDALVVPGGESTTISKLAIEFGLHEPVAKRILAGMPAYGSCAGMIMLASEVLDGRPDQRSFGGIDMTVRRNAFGRQVDSFEAPVQIAGVEGEPFHAVFIRAPWVERIGAGVAVLGRIREARERIGVEGREARERIGVEGREARERIGVEGREARERIGGESAGRDAAGRIVAVRQRNLLATAFHPELTGDLRVHRFFVEMVRGEHDDGGG